jgi:hypothetical protein
MKKTTLNYSNLLAKRLTKYGALTAAIAGVADASGQIVYTNVDPDFISVDLPYYLDVDNDGNPDFTLLDVNVSYVGIYANLSAPGNQFLGSKFIYTSDSGTYSYFYPFAMETDSIISEGITSWFGGEDFGIMNSSSCYYVGPNWCDVTNKYLGLRFITNGQTYYGWARLDVNAAGDEFILKDYAYNATAGEPILAGETPSLSFDDNQISKTKIVALKKSIAMYQLPEAVEYTIFDMAGKKVLNGLINSNTYVVDAGSLNTGVYLVEIIDINTKATIRKKIVL